MYQQSPYYTQQQYTTAAPYYTHPQHNIQYYVPGQPPPQQYIQTQQPPPYQTVAHTAHQHSSTSTPIPSQPIPDPTLQYQQQYVHLPVQQYATQQYATQQSTPYQQQYTTQQQLDYNSLPVAITVPPQYIPVQQPYTQYTQPQQHTASQQQPHRVFNPTVLSWNQLQPTPQPVQHTDKKQITKSMMDLMEAQAKLQPLIKQTTTATHITHRTASLHKPVVSSTKNTPIHSPVVRTASDVKPAISTNTANRTIQPTNTVTNTLSSTHTPTYVPPPVDADEETETESEGEPDDDTTATTKHTYKHKPTATHTQHIHDTSSSVTYNRALQHVDNVLNELTHTQSPTNKPTTRNSTPTSQNRSLQHSNNKTPADSIVKIGTNPYVCEYENCTRTFSQPHHLRMHIERSHTEQTTENDDGVERPYKCDRCQRTYLNSSSLGRHLKTHGVYKKFKSDHYVNDDTVDNDIDNKDELTDSGRLVTRRLIELSNTINAESDTEPTTSPSKSHTDKVELQCPNPGCTRKFTKQNYLSQHLYHCKANPDTDSYTLYHNNTTEKSNNVTELIDTPGEIVACTVPNCKRTFASQKLLQLHLPYHIDDSQYKKSQKNGDTAYICTECNYAYSAHSSLIRHQKSSGHCTKVNGVTIGVTEDNKDSECAICTDGGNIFCCDNCPYAYHIHCILYNNKPVTNVDMIPDTVQCNQLCDIYTKQSLQCTTRKHGRTLHNVDKNAEIDIDDFIDKLTQANHNITVGHIDIINDAEYVCSECQRSFTKPHHLKMHMDYIHPTPAIDSMSMLLEAEKQHQKNALMEQTNESNDKTELLGDSSNAVVPTEHTDTHTVNTDSNTDNKDVNTDTDIYDINNNYHTSISDTTTQPDESTGGFFSSTRHSRQLYDTHHDITTPFHCPRDGCNRVFTRQSFLTQHLKKGHRD